MKKYVPNFIKTEQELHCYKQGVNEGLDHAEPSAKTMLLFERIDGRFNLYIKTQKDILDAIKDMKDNELKDIKEQTTKHNNRMKKIEVWRGYMTGAVAVITVIVVPLVGWVFFQTIRTVEILSTLN